MSLYMPWRTATIANGDTVSDEVDLMNNCEYMQVILPPLTDGTIKVQVCEASCETFQDLGSGVTTATTTGGYSTTFKIGGYQFIKIVSSVSQGDERIIKVRGMKI